MSHTNFTNKLTPFSPAKRKCTYCRGKYERIQRCLTCVGTYGSWAWIPKRQPRHNKMNEPQETQSKPEAVQLLAPIAGAAPTRDPRNYICADAPAVGARRLAMRRSKWLEDWWISYSPRNDNQNAEGTWEEWVSLASKILEADGEWKAQNART